MSWAIRDQTLSDFFENLIEILKIKIFKIAIKLIDFNRKLLSSQATHRNVSQDNIFQYKYKIISVGGLWAAEIAIKIDHFFRGFCEFGILIDFLIFYFCDKIDRFDRELLSSQTTH